MHSPTAFPTSKAAARVQRLPHGAQHRAHGPGGLPAEHHGPVREVPRSHHGELTSRRTTARFRKLGYLKTAKCYDCHGAHDILPVTDPRSHLSRNNIVKTCAQCHTGSHRQFAGYLTHATHHDPVRYPILFYTFWGMTTLLVGTFAWFGAHTALWLPRSLQYRKALQDAHALEGNTYVRRFRTLRPQPAPDGDYQLPGAWPPPA